MDIKQAAIQLIRDGFILVFNRDDIDIVKTAESLAQAGIFNMEVTCRIRQPLDKMSRVKKAMPNFAVGSASLVDYAGMLERYNRRHGDDPLPSVDDVVNAGADYLVSSVNFSDHTYSRYAGRKLLIPGCGSASEIAAQFSKGANFCKLFPAGDLGGPSFIKAIDAPLHRVISIVPTSGTNLANIPSYIETGVLVMGGSFSMIDKTVMQQVVQNGAYDLLAKEFGKIKQAIDECRIKKWPDLDLKTATIDDIRMQTGRIFNL